MGSTSGQKGEWAARVRSRHGRAPSPDELEDYVSTWTPSRLASLRAEAASALATYAEAVISDEEPRILREAVKGTFWRGVWQSMVAAFLYTLALIGVGLVLAIVGVDVLGILRSAGEAVNAG